MMTMMMIMMMLHEYTLLLLLLLNKRVKLAAGSDVNVMLIDLHCRQDLV